MHTIHGQMMFEILVSVCHPEASKSAAAAASGASGAATKTAPSQVRVSASPFALNSSVHALENYQQE